MVNPALKSRGYEGKIASYEQGLRFINQETQPEGWGRLHLVLGNTYYECGKRYSAPKEYWNKAQHEYQQALLTLTLETEPQLYLEVLQQLTMVLLGLAEAAQAQEVQTNATDLWWKLLLSENRSDEKKKQLALKFTPLAQLAVDVAVARGELLSGLEIAEHVKNACFTWQYYGWTEEMASPNYVEMQKLLNPSTAIVFWHISPYAFRTFIVKHKATEPIPIFTPVLNISNDELPLPEAVQRLVEFEDWLKDWHLQYQDYGSYTQEKQNKSNHSWRKLMEQKLLKLQQILNISAISRELEGINNLILIPHRDLHKLPLHALFSLDSDSAFTGNISYLPSFKLGLMQQSQSANLTEIIHFKRRISQQQRIFYTTVWQTRIRSSQPIF
ncbi:MAG: hypothetical protein HC908_19055 [Calothrix sp. SM1_7_51]|nr:hypothetical protein [Calothrix sp. SM1_7_51]